MLNLSVDFSAQSIRIDHVIEVVHNLDSAINKYQQMGFVIKLGSLHANGLKNAHIKLANKSSYELMSIQGEPTDNVAKHYQELIEEHEGGVYICLTGLDTAELIALLSEKEYVYTVIEGALWNYIILDEPTDLRPFFFIDYKKPLPESKKYWNHKNGSKGIQTVYVEGGLQTQKFLTDIDFINLGDYSFKSSTGIIELVRPCKGKRLRLTGVDFDAVNKICIRY
ncbi:VOC family protein [Carboxylicivirga marina]|nr:VOC family protein [uncultured Carboxylicivirga sp.]